MSAHGSNSPRLRPALDFAAPAVAQTTAAYGLGYRQHAASGLISLWQDGAPLAPSLSASRRLQLSAKRCIDIVIATLALLFFAPLLLSVMLSIKLSDRGPALFRQVRVGKDGRTFTIYKFRSMYLHRCNPDGVSQTISADDRIMPIGAFIRRTSIDELPQLINVLTGDMSIVGPRPHVPGQLAAGAPYHLAVPYYPYRWGMRPGLTGWAQANGYRGPTTDLARAQARVDHDIAYIQNFSLTLDLAIMARTAQREFLRGTGF